MPWHEVYSPSSPTGVRQPTAPPYLYLVIGWMGYPRHARGGGVGWGAMDGPRPGRVRVCTLYILARTRKNPGQRMASRGRSVRTAGPEG